MLTLGQLIVKECKQTLRSLIYWVIVLILIFDFTSQLGDMEIDEKPKPGQESYGIRQSDDPELIMRGTLGQLAEEYYRESYTTYPIGFYKNVTLNEADDRKIGEILKETAGISSREEIGQIMEKWYARQGETVDTIDEETTVDMEDAPSENVSPEDIMMNYQEPLKVNPAEGLAYERFIELMDEADKILGGGSSYSKEYREKNAQVSMTYEDALEEYNTLIEKDRLTGGYARLFSDYMVIFLGILPVFLAVTRGLRDRRASMQELIYTRSCPSLVVVASRYLAMVVMLTLPVLALSMSPLSKCISHARGAGISVDMLAFVKYIFGWQLPTILVVTAVGMFLTELTDTAVAVLIQGAWWFITVFAGVAGIDGGAYGWSLTPRHNTEMNWQGFKDGFSQLAANRALYTAIALVLMVLSAYIYAQKRKGRYQIRGKILANRKSKS